MNAQYYHSPIATWIRFDGVNLTTEIKQALSRYEFKYAAKRGEWYSKEILSADVLETVFNAEPMDKPKAKDRYTRIKMTRVLAVA